MIDPVPTLHDREHFFGPWSDEVTAAAEFDRRVAESGLFERTFSEVRGYYLTHRPNRQDRDARIDRILLPGARLRDSGWSRVIGVEIKRSGEKLGPALAQAIDYTYCVWNVGHYWMLAEHVFLWPLRPQLAAVQSLMVQNCVGCVDESRHSPLIFTLERQVIRVNDDSSIHVAASVAGTKNGSR